MWPDVETGTVSITFYRKYLCQELEEVFIFLFRTHLQGVVLYFLFVVYTTFDAQMIFVLTFLKVLSDGSRNDGVKHTGKSKVNQFVVILTSDIDVTKIVCQRICCYTIGMTEVCLQHFDGCSCYDTMCQSLFGSQSTGKVILNLLVDECSNIADLTYIRVGFQIYIAQHVFPIRVVADKSGFCIRHFVLHDAGKLTGKRLQYFALALTDTDKREVFKITWMNREEVYVCVQVVVHVREHHSEL